VSGLKDVVKITRASIKKVESLFDPMKNACQEVLEIVDQKQREYDCWQEEEYEKEQERLRKEAEAEQKRLEKNAKARAKRVLEKDGHSPDAQAIANDIKSSVPQVEVGVAQAPVAPKVEGVIKVKLWDYEIVDEDLIPQKIDSLDLTLWERDFSRRSILKAREELASDDDPQPIEGIRFFQKDQTRYGRL
jgi:hypothetical protein